MAGTGMDMIGIVCLVAGGAGSMLTLMACTLAQSYLPLMFYGIPSLILLMAGGYLLHG